MDQLDFFKQVQKSTRIESDTEFKHLISKILNISLSGAYKKIKCITHLTLLEMTNICKYLNININLSETNNEVQNHPFIFHCDDLVSPPKTYEQWAANILNHAYALEKLKPDYQVYSYQHEISYFHLMPFYNLLYFKLFAWNRSSWFAGTNKKLDLSRFRSNHALNSILDKINQHYINYDSTEIWHVDFLGGILNQIKYFHQLDIFESQEDLKEIIKDLKKLVSHLRIICETGSKRDFAKPENKGKIKIFLNYTHSSSSITHIKSSKTNIIYHQFLHPNYIRSSNKEVCTYTEQWLNKVEESSSLISRSDEVLRKQFFDQIIHNVVALEKEVNINL